MDTKSRTWLSRMLGWFHSEPRLTPTKTARPFIEALEDRTGLSSTPATLTAEYVASFFRDQADTAITQPELTQKLADVAGPVVQENNPLLQNDDSIDPGIPLPPAIDEMDSLYPHFDVYEPTANALTAGKESQPASTFHDDTPLSAKQRMVLSVSSYDALQQQAGKSSLNAPGNMAASSVDAYFQIQRTPITQQALEVQYEVKAFTSNGMEAQAQSARFDAGSGKIDITDVPQALRQQRDVQIITLTLHEHKQYQLARPGATIFVANHQQAFSENVLLRACQEGQSAEALSRLVDMHRPRVLQACYNVLGNFADAEDASQLVFMMFAQQHFKLQQTVGRWLHAVARNVAISFLRSRQRRKRHEMNAMKSEIGTALGQGELREEIDLALDQIPPQLKQAVQLRYLEGWSQNEVAEFLGCPRGTVAQRAARGLQALRKVMAAS
jgi:RNA polymerase sigma factor (sigma-70 family)